MRTSSSLRSSVSQCQLLEIRTGGVCSLGTSVSQCQLLEIRTGGVCSLRSNVDLKVAASDENE